MKIIKSFTLWATADELLKKEGFEVSCKTPDGWIYKNKDTFEFVKVEYASPFWHVLKPEILNT